MAKANEKEQIRNCPLLGLKTECAKDRCAWWDDFTNSCCIVSMSRDIWLMQNSSRRHGMGL